MRDRRLLVVAALVLAVGLAVYFRGTPSESSPDHRAGSDAADGASALKQLAAKLGHPTSTLQDGFAPDLGTRVLFVLSPSTGFSQEDAKRLTDYVTAGGVVVYAAEQGDPRLDGVLHVGRLSTLVSGDATGTGPMLSGVQQVSGGPAVQPLVPRPAQVVLLRSRTGQPIGFEEQIGQGRVITLSDPLPLCNGYLEKADNGRLASDLVSLAGGGGQVGFDEYHHLPPGPGSPLTGWLSTAWGAALSWAVGLLFVGLPGGGDRSSTEYVAAVGYLLQRTRAAAVTAEVVREATRRTIARRHGIGAMGAALDEAFRKRSPKEADELAAAEAQLSAAGRREEPLLAAARRLHSLAYPRRSQP